jgi:molybdopterin synthase sulfur carrier subunit
MSRVTFELPNVLAAVVKARTVELDADTLAGAFTALARERPGLALHLLDEQGALRQHVLCFLNGTNIRWLEGRDVPLRGGDRLTILQAVTGG